MAQKKTWRSLQVQGGDDGHGVAKLTLHRPRRSNAFDSSLFSELPLAIAHLDSLPDVRAIVLAGAGHNFCSGIDLSLLLSPNVPDSGGNDGGDDDGREGKDPDGARDRERARRFILDLQDSFSSIEACRKPVIAAVHGACIGAGVDLIAACDLRYCSNDAYFSVKEIDLAIVADLGTLQRLPLLVGYGNTMELALTGRKFSAQEAKSIGLVNDVFASKEALEENVTALARSIASKSPLAVVGTKRVLIKSRDLSVQNGLDYVATWNSAMLGSHDLKEAMEAWMQKRKASFSKL